MRRALRAVCRSRSSQVHASAPDPAGTWEGVGAADAPLAALRAAGVLERIAARVARETAGALCDDGMPAEAVATALGTTRSKTLVLLLTTRAR